MSQLDFTAAKEFGYKIKLLAVIRRDFESQQISVCVRPHLLPLSNPMARVDQVFNGVSLLGDVVGETFLVGKGAGPDPTSSAVISDLADATLALLGAPPPVISEENIEVYQQLSEGLRVQPKVAQKGAFYVRLKVQDEPGVLAALASALAEHQISIARLYQREEPAGQQADVIFTTHQCTEGALSAALERIQGLGCVSEAAFVIRIFA